mgnify:CR=1 FL=1
MKVRIELPYPLPLWNRILAMHPWSRKKLRDLIHSFVQDTVAGKSISEDQLRQYDHLIRPKKK